MITRFACFKRGGSITSCPEDRSKENLETWVNFFCITIIFTLKEVGGGNTICIYHHSEAWRRGGSRKNTKGRNTLPSCILGEVMYGIERNGRKWPPDGQQSWNRISTGCGDRLQGSLMSKIGYFDDRLTGSYPFLSRDSSLLKLDKLPENFSKYNTTNRRRLSQSCYEQHLKGRVQDHQ